MTEATESSERVLAGDERAIARLISMVEREDPARLSVLRALHESSGHAHVIGVTGPPGAGKSTLCDKLVASLRARGRRVAVIAVDPSSPFTGGAILGDRIRMQRHATDGGVFIRSLATRGHLGGLSRATSEAARVLDAAGYDDVIVETVGVGQSEVDIVRIADTIVLVSVPGLGDDIQAIKAGVMEIGDVFCVNKADRDGAERVVREIRAMLETAVMNGAATRFSPLFAALDEKGLSGGRAFAAYLPPDGHGSRAMDAAHHGGDAAMGRAAFAIPPVAATVAETGQGVEELVDCVKAHEAALAATGLLRERRRLNLAWELGKAAAERLLSSLESDEKRKRAMQRLADEVLDKRLDFNGALEALESTIASA